MFIEQITLQNIKSYGSTPTTIYFKQGVNLISGANGAGKSTILEAIGFVLFDSLPYSQNDFERRGKSGATKATIRLHSAYDNRVYDVERAIPARYRVIDVQDHIDEGIQSKDDLLEWLCQHLKVDDKEDLRSLFINAVGVQQGTITAVFLETEGDRRKKFDTLLHVEDYESAWGNLKPTGNYIADLINKNTNEIVRKEGQTERLPDLEASAEVDRDAIVEKEETLTDVSTRLEKLKTTLEHLDQQKQQLGELNHQIERADAEIERLEEAATTAQTDYVRSLEAHEIVTENAESYRLYEEAVGRVNVLEEQRKERDALLQNIREVEKQIASTQQRIEQLIQDLAEVETAEVLVTELAPLVQCQEQLEQEQKLALEQQKERDHLQEEITEGLQKRDNLDTELHKLRDKVGERKQLIEQIESTSQEKNQIDAEIEKLTRQFPELEAALESAQQVFDETETQLKQYQELQDSIKRQETALKKTEASHQRISDELAKRESLDIQIGALGDQIIQANSQKSAADNNLPRINRELTELRQMREMLGVEGAVCPVCRRDMDGQAHEEALAYYDTQELKFHAEREQAQETITQLTTSLKTWQSQKAALEYERDALANQAALKSAQGEITSIEDEIARLQALLAEMVDVPQIHADAETALNDSRAVVDQHNGHIDRLNTQRTEKVEAISDLNRQIADLPSQDELQRREGDYETLLNKINESETRLSGLANIDDEVQELDGELAELDDPRKKQSIAESTAAKRQLLENQHQEAQETLAAHHQELGSAQEELQPYASLDDDLGTVRKQRDDTADGHQHYIENKQIADLLIERENRLANFQDELTESTEKRDELVQKHAELSEGFDEEQYTATQEKHTRLETQRTELGADIKHLKSQLDGKENEIKDLRAIITEIEGLQVKAERLDEEQKTFKFVREAIRYAGPRIRKRKVQVVSEIAENYFSEIVNDFTMRLHWDADDYGIYVEQSGEKRPFSVLSGGEQMIAALSVRLALLIHMTRIRLIFLDEPTINLDENRRIQLAERLNQIDGLQQLFVISHDDTFISGSNHVINVIKEAGTSRVEMSHAALY